MLFAILVGSFSLAMLAPEMQGIYHAHYLESSFDFLTKYLYIAVTHAQSAAAKLYETIDRVPTIDSASPEGLKPEKCIGEITLEHVKFNYPSRPTVPIVKDLSITFPAGRTVALVGASGSGKSTIISLVERFYDPLEGSVQLDGTDIRDLNVKWLRSQIGLVSQEPTLFATTIKGNVAHGLIGTKWEHASEEEKMKLIKEACIKANADGFITKLPLGYETMVGERGFLLSGGQKQRIAIARAIVSDPRILLLDEATSALDTQSEGIVQNALDKAAAGRTTITIAHRLSTIKDADCIYVMGDGLVLEFGTHDKLLANDNGPYARLVNAQKLREAREKRSNDDIEGQGAVDEKEKENENDLDSDTVASSDYEIEDLRERAMVGIPLSRSDTGRSLASEILEQRRKERGQSADKNYSLWYLFKRMGWINRIVWRQYLIGGIAAVREYSSPLLVKLSCRRRFVFSPVTGAVYPAFSVIFSKAISNFSEVDLHQRRRDGDRDALRFFIIAVISTFMIGIQNYVFGATAAELTSKLRALSFRAILRQDVEFFDKDENSTGQLTASVSDNPQKVHGLAGVTLGA